MASNDTRRTFLQASAVGLAGAGMSYWIGGRARAQGPAKSPNEQPVVAYIGTGIRYHEDLGHVAVKFGPTAAICDVDSVQAGRALQVAFDEHRALGRPLTVDVYEDYRHMLDRKDVDVVFIGTPDHWHTKIAIDAMRAGKDVYCEKPLTLTIREGQQLLEVERETKRVVQVGTIQRTEFGHMFATAVSLAAAGRVGKLKRITCAIGGARRCEPLAVAAPPKSLNWDLWQGQTPAVDYRQGPIGDVTGYGAGHPLGRTHHYFRWWYEYSGGKMTDWGAHHVDIAVWALELIRSSLGKVTIDPIAVDHPVPMPGGMPSRDDQFNTAVTFNVKLTLDDGVELRITDNAQDLGFENGIMFEGDAGRFLVNRGKLAGKPVEELKTNPLPADYLQKLYGGDPPTGHVANFFECVKSRKTPIADMASHHRAISICHAVNIALRLGRKLTYDTATEQFVDDPQANTFMARPQRKGFEIVV
ncbi:MAG: Gfo/Idh/MocA family oxidoreductase [Pirellulales bacterium]|nr:Gfo/Idh/MocA family oxidoreductase [Pirellulales bacterium]